ncbi:MAG: hypothetical protein ACR2PR_06585 [Pseudohongiellaceae bacterium]
MYGDAAVDKQIYEEDKNTALGLARKAAVTMNQTFDQDSWLEAYDREHAHQLEENPPSDDDTTAAHINLETAVAAGTSDNSLSDEAEKQEVMNEAEVAERNRLFLEAMSKVALPGVVCRVNSITEKKDEWTINLVADSRERLLTLLSGKAGKHLMLSVQELNKPKYDQKDLFPGEDDGSVADPAR